MESSNTTKRVLYNSAYLYIRGAVSLFLGFYASRILLQNLGVDDFGLYGVVGGIIGFISFLNIAMSSSSSRYITYELAKGTLESQQKVFTAICIVHFSIALVTILLAESIGLWYISNVLVVPDGRIQAAHWVFQMSLLVAILNITQVPYNALVTAHEKMAFMSLWAALGDVLRFIAVVFLFFVNHDKLIAYSILFFAVNFVIAVGYRIYCKRFFHSCKLVKFRDKELYYQILSFASFTTFSSFAFIARQQGSILLINRFFGVAINAAGNLASMVSANVYGFTQNVVTAFKPQIIKNYATGDYNLMQNNISLCVKLSLAIYSLIAVPIFIEMDYVLDLWLVETPLYTSLFCRLTLLGCAFGLMNLVITIGIQATSNVKRNACHISSLALFSMIIMYFVFQCGGCVDWAFYIFVATEFFNLILSTNNLKRMIPQIRLLFIFRIIVKLLSVIVVSGFMAYWIRFILQTSPIFRLLLVVMLYWTLFLSLFYFIMFDNNTRKSLFNKLALKIKFHSDK